MGRGGYQVQRRLPGSEAVTRITPVERVKSSKKFQKDPAVPAREPIKYAQGLNGPIRLFPRMTSVAERCDKLFGIGRGGNDKAGTFF